MNYSVCNKCRLVSTKVITGQSINCKCGNNYRVNKLIKGKKELKKIAEEASK